MRLIVIYGPPAVGKLTVAQKLQKLTGYGLFHNHLTADLASSIFPTGTKEYSELSQTIRLEALKIGMRSGLKGLIFTFTYGIETYRGKSDDSFLRKVLNEARKTKTDITFVCLTASVKELARRVKNLSREKFDKLTDPFLLNRIMRNYRMNRKIPFVQSLVINTERTKPSASADQIRNCL